MSGMRMKRYRRFEHTADIGIEAFGATREELFENAAFGMFDQAIDIQAVQEAREETVEVEAESLEYLLKEWLSELLFRFAGKGRVFRRFKVHEMTDTTLKASAFGEALDPERHGLKTDLKAVTYHQLSVRKEGKRWKARVIIDV